MRDEVIAVVADMAHGLVVAELTHDGQIGIIRVTGSFAFFGSFDLFGGTRVGKAVGRLHTGCLCRLCVARHRCHHAGADIAATGHGREIIGAADHAESIQCLKGAEAEGGRAYAAAREAYAETRRIGAELFPVTKPGLPALVDGVGLGLLHFRK